MNDNITICRCCLQETCEGAKQNETEDREAAAVVHQLAEGNIVMRCEALFEALGGMAR